MNRQQIQFLFLNIGHFLDHFFLLIFATVAALRLSDEWQLSYAELIPYATPGFIAFGLATVPAGWLADKWSREGMMAIFFIGIGLSSILASLATSPLQIALGLTAIGLFAAIYHPVGLAMVIQGRVKTGVPLAINGIFGNLGVASAALLTGYLLDTTGWRAAFIIPGSVAIAIGLLYLVFISRQPGESSDTTGKTSSEPSSSASKRERSEIVIRVFAIIFLTTAIGGLIFQSTTFALPKVLAERLDTLAQTATRVGGYAFMVFAIAAFAQLVVGYLVDNRSARTVFITVAGLQALFFALMTTVSDPVVVLLVSVAFMLVVFGQIPINDVLIGRLTRSEWRSRVYSLRYIVTFSVMASSVPLIAWLHAGWGFDALFRVLAVAAGGIFLATLLLPKTGIVLAR